MLTRPIKFPPHDKLENCCGWHPIGLARKGCSNRKIDYIFGRDRVELARSTTHRAIPSLGVGNRRRAKTVQVSAPPFVIMSFGVL